MYTSDTPRGSTNSIPKGGGLYFAAVGVAAGMRIVIATIVWGMGWDSASGNPDGTGFGMRD